MGAIKKRFFYAPKTREKKQVIIILGLYIFMSTTLYFVHLVPRTSNLRDIDWFVVRHFDPVYMVSNSVRVFTEIIPECSEWIISRTGGLLFYTACIAHYGIKVWKTHCFVNARFTLCSRQPR